MELRAPRGGAVTQIFAAGHVRSSSPPDPKVKYQIEYSTDGGKTWQTMLKDWTVNRQGDEPADFWSQSFCWANAEIRSEGAPSTIRGRFRNDGGKAYARAEVHVAYRTQKADATAVTFAWSDAGGDHTASQRFSGKADERAWLIPTGKATRTKWVEMSTSK